jgi:hypothetical protein
MGEAFQIHENPVRAGWVESPEEYLSEAWNCQLTSPPDIFSGIQWGYSLLPV